MGCKCPHCVASREARMTVDYGPTVEEALREIAGKLEGQYGMSGKAVGLLLLQRDPEIMEELARRESAETVREIHLVIDRVENALDSPVPYYVALRRREAAAELAKRVASADAGGRSPAAWLGRILVHPILGLPALFAVIYFGLYQFVGVFGAGTLVDYLESNIFETIINPWVNQVVDALFPWYWVRELLAHEYGIITLGVRYAVAIIFPIVGTFFLVFSVIEDSGYLPRLALMVDRLFRAVGLNGRAVIPMTLGFGCDTMATMVTRTLETRRERILATLLLALAVPCSAQLGVIMGILSGTPGGLMVWAGTVTLVFLLVGYLTARLLPGRGPSFYMEVPPLRMPSLLNVWRKTYTRMQWYFREVLPLFILGSVFIWVGRITGIFTLLLTGLGQVVSALGLPEETAIAFLFGFFRRDYGAAGLFDLYQNGTLNPLQLVVSSVTLTLFIPCVAQFTMMAKERGWRTTLLITGFIFPFAFAVGWVLFKILGALGFGTT